MTLAFLIFYGSLIVLVWTRISTVMAYFQQEEYDNRRFLQAWPRLSVLDVKFTLQAAIVFWAIHWMVARGVFSSFFLGLLILSGSALVLAWQERRFWQRMKKRLVRTQRARRLIVVSATLLGCGSVSLVSLLHYSPLLLPLLLPLPLLLMLVPALMLQMVPASLLLANVLLKPSQERENARYVAQAREKLARYPGVRIGITGSFGKTTVKHVLGDALDQLSTVFYSKGSINTVLGHTRHVRQRLQPAHRYFIAEMGAYGKGSVQRLCELIEPNHAIITSIGLAHNERFGGLEEVAKAKSELAAWVAACTGRIVLTQDVACYEPFARLIKEYPIQCVVVGDQPTQEAHYRISQVKTGAEGTSLHLTRAHDGYGVDLSLPLLGQHMRDNLALIGALLLELGWSGEAVQAALGGVRHVPHRLAPRPGPNGAIILDDAYNANPVGMANAIELARHMADEAGGKAMIITPGLVELGDQHEAEHRRLGELAGRRLAHCIVVTPERIPTFVEGINAVGGLAETAVSYWQAREKIDASLGPGDVLLIANDLPDLLGRRIWL